MSVPPDSAAVQHWPLEALWEALEPRLPGFTAEWLAQVDSTNSECMRRLRAGQADPLLLVAQVQTAGRGRMGRTWHSDPSGAALTFSLALPLAPEAWSGLSLVAGLAVAQALQTPVPAVGSGEPRICLKWPNDLWLQSAGQERKLGGILVETASLAPAAPGRTRARWVVVGVGLNITPPPPVTEMSVPPGGLRELDPRWNAPGALGCVVVPLLDALHLFQAEGFAPFAAAFAARDVLAGRSVRLSDGREGEALGVAADGALRVRGGQEIWEVNSTEISVRPVPQPAHGL